MPLSSHTAWVSAGGGTLSESQPMGGKGHCGPVPTDTLDATAADRASGPDSTSQGPVDSCGALTILTVRRGPVPATRRDIGPEKERACAVRHCPVRRLLRGPAVVAPWGRRCWAWTRTGTPMWLRCSP